jgi:hypothetical protein
MPKVPMPIKRTVGRHTDSPRHQAQPPPWSPRHQAAPAASTPATAQAAQQPAAKSPLVVLRSNVVDLHDSKTYWHANGWSAGDHLKTDELVDMAHNIIDGLEVEGKDKLPVYAVILGRTFVIKKNAFGSPKIDIGTVHDSRDVFDFWWRSQHWLTQTDNISTDKDPVLIMFQDGVCTFVPSEFGDSMSVAMLHELAKNGGGMSSRYLQTEQRLRQKELWTAGKRLRGW